MLNVNFYYFEIYKFSHNTLYLKKQKPRVIFNETFYNSNLLPNYTKTFYVLTKVENRLQIMVFSNIIYYQIVYQKYLGSREVIGTVCTSDCSNRTTFVFKDYDSFVSQGDLLISLDIFIDYHMKSNQAFATSCEQWYEVSLSAVVCQVSTDLVLTRLGFQYRGYRLKSLLWCMLIVALLMICFIVYTV